MGPSQARDTCRPRLLVVGPVPPPAHGVTVMTEALLRGGLEDSFAVFHVDTSDHRNVGNVGRLEATNVLLALSHLANFVVSMRHRPDLVYLPLSQGAAGFLRDSGFLLVAKIARRRVALHAHGAQYRDFFRRVPRSLHAAIRWVFVPVGAVAVLAESQRDQFMGLTPRETRVSVVPNGVADEWPSGPPKRVDREACTVLFLSNLHPEKGFLDVLEAVPEVLKQAPHTRFVFAGDHRSDDATRQRARDFVTSVGISRSVVFTGKVDSRRRNTLLEEADILVFPPRWEEGQGIVAIEAMSASLPVVFTASGGLAETVRDGKEGLLVPKASPKAIASSIVRLIMDETLRMRLGTAGRLRYEREYTLEQWLCAMRNFFAGALQGTADGS